MKRLVIIRHGKSSWKHDVEDDERPLKKRAYKDAEVVLNVFKAFYDQNINKDKAAFWSSHAVRAHETAKIFKDKLVIDESDFEVKESLYTFNHTRLKKVIQTASDSIETLVIFSHNPAITNFVNHAGHRTYDNIPTTGLCVIEFDVDSWQSISSGKTLLTLFPKNLR
ncbi:SixA phosphatase family protein [Zunongwangia endophytica]|uniref:SixA phosphatase family protein n=1 Tax=Zunongwangia endophytica TaxID=1808945 RepID=A0ABV8H195_9FLAO|nr:histidine phosphatase family protein [Zunongwangia endophytica]MDN3594561.1 histidine phosphatase family protein [Zunongwangia endophytica]